MKAVIGAILEDSFLSSGYVNLEAREIVQSTVRREKINPRGTKPELLETLTKTLKEVFDNVPDPQELVVGLGILGPCDYESGVFQGNDLARFGSLHDVDLKQEISSALNIPKSSVRLVNDSVCFLRGEVFGGAVRSYSKSIGITLGAGLGSAIYEFNKVRDANYFRTPFKSGTAEDLLSVAWLTRQFYERTGIPARTILEMKMHDRPAVLEEVFDLFGHNLAEFLIQVSLDERPEAIIVGGHMQASNKLFFDKVITKVHAAGISIPILRTYLGEKATILGAASIWSES